jgi:hypothetical protein
MAKERPHLTKERLPHVKVYGTVFFSQKLLFTVTFDPFPGHEKNLLKKSSLPIFLTSFYLINKILT